MCYKFRSLVCRGQGRITLRTPNAFVKSSYYRKSNLLRKQCRHCQEPSALRLPGCDSRIPFWRSISIAKSMSIQFPIHEFEVEKMEASVVVLRTSYFISRTHQEYRCWCFSLLEPPYECIPLAKRCRSIDICPIAVDPKRYVLDALGRNGSGLCGCQ